MPKILGLQEQQQALKEIRNLLKDIAGLNNFLNVQNPEGLYHISVSDKDGTRYGADILLENKTDIDCLVALYKEHVKTRILDLAQEYRIALDPEDEEVLGIKTTDSVDPDYSV